MLARLGRFFREHPESGAIIILWVTALVAAQQYPSGSLLRSFFTLATLSLMIGGAVYLMDAESKRLSNLRRIVADIRSFLSCGCLEGFNTCPVPILKEETCNCLCHWPELYT